MNYLKIAFLSSGLDLLYTSSQKITVTLGVKLWQFNWCS